MRQEFRVRGLHCSQEVALIEKRLSHEPGVQNLSFDILAEKMTVDYSDAITRGQIEHAVETLGMSAAPWSEKREAAGWGGLAFCAVSGLALVTAMIQEALSSNNFWVGLFAHDETHADPPVVVALYVIAILAGAWSVVPKAWHAIKARHIEMNVLVLVALIGATAMGEVSEAASLAFIWTCQLVGLLLESAQRAL